MRFLTRISDTISVCLVDVLTDRMQNLALFADVDDYSSLVWRQLPCFYITELIRYCASDT